MPDRDLKPDHITHTADAISCAVCRDFLALAGTPLQVSEDAAWFAARHERCESRKAKR